MSHASATGLLPPLTLPIVASATSSVADFDFLLGRWAVHNRKLKTRLANCTEWVEFEAVLEVGKALAGTANQDQFHAIVAGDSFDGMAVRLFEATTRLWRIYWAASNAGTFDVPQVGSFAGPVGLFYAAAAWHGRPVHIVYRWDATDPHHPTWSQAFSADEGKTWEWNWYMHLQRSDR